MWICYYSLICLVNVGFLWNLSREIGYWWAQDAHGCKIEDASGCLRMENLQNKERKDLQVEFDSEGTLGCSDPVHPP